jgi:hypothetical protein
MSKILEFVDEQQALYFTPMPYRRLYGLHLNEANNFIAQIANITGFDNTKIADVLWNTNPTIMANVNGILKFPRFATKDLAQVFAMLAEQCV